MTLEKEVNKLLKKYLKRDENICHAEKLFVAKSVLLWVYENNKEAKAIKYYIGEIERYLSGDITLYWEDGTIKVRKDHQG